jgi:mycothiol synthase
MSPTLPAGYIARRPHIEDMAAAARLINHTGLAQSGVSLVNADQLGGIGQLPGHDLARDDWLIETVNGALVAGSLVLTMEPYTEVQLFAIVAPEHEGRGLGEWLLDQCEARAAEVATRAPAGEAVSMLTQTWTGADQALARLDARGYQLQRVFRFMQIDFEPGVPTPAPELPAGMRVRTFVRGQDERVTWEVAEESFADHWNHHPLPLEQWTQLVIEAREAFDPSCWWLAIDGDEVAGVALCDAHAPGGTDYGWVATLGVRRAWRGRGVARALLATAFTEFQRRGRHGVGLGVDAESPTGADRLYYRAGMRSIADLFYYAKPLHPAPTNP